MIDGELQAWRRQENRKPLLLRGARQVGKSSAVRKLGEQFEYFLEINFEEQRRVHDLFEGDSLSPQELCEKFEILYNVPVIAGKTLVFFDEIQACPAAILSLRFFYEKWPELHVIAAGSLLEFALTGLSAFGVGRIRSLFMHPFSFYEFLGACGEQRLLEAAKTASPSNPVPEPVHQKLLGFLKRFLVVGGMPEVVSFFCKTGDVRECQRLLDDLIISLKADFAKYKKAGTAPVISAVFDSVVGQMGGKFTYAKTGQGYNHAQVKDALELLRMAGLVIPVTHTSANGLPLGAGANPKMRKMLLPDTGIFQRLLGLALSDLLLGEDFETVNKGHIAELHTGLELLKAGSCYEQQQLYYWHREALNSNAEVDYVFQRETKIMPVEVKAGTRGSMQSMYLYLNEKSIATGTRVSLENFCQYDRINVVPLYAVANLRK